MCTWMWCRYILLDKRLVAQQECLWSPAVGLNFQLQSLTEYICCSTDKGEAGTESCSSASRCSHGTNSFSKLVQGTERQTQILFNIKLPFAYSKSHWKQQVCFILGLEVPKP